MNNRKRVIKVIALILAFLMVASAAVIVFTLLASVGGHVHTH